MVENLLLKKKEFDYQKLENFNPQFNFLNFKKIENFLMNGKIIHKDENFEDMTFRVFNSIMNIEKKFNIKPNEIKINTERLIRRFLNKEFVPSTPILTNAGRYLTKPLSACSVPDISLNEDLKKIKTDVDKFHQQGMGTGFNLNECEDPTKMLNYLNKIALEGQKSGKEDRPVGNMGVIDIYHPKILDFIFSKREKEKSWFFNISINCDDEFFLAVKKNKNITLKNGSKINAKYLLKLISKTSWECGDPGLVFLDKFNKHNPVPHLGKYHSTAPCGEVGLSKGETCQFSYINIAKFIKNKQLNYELLNECISDVVRFLDNALEISLEALTTNNSFEIMSKKRKIGLGICGFADALIKLDYSYGGKESLEFIRDIMSFINYKSKEASVELSKERGPFLAFFDNETKIGKKFFLRRYGNLISNTITLKDWIKLEKNIEKNGIRHVSTMALPPTGRSAQVISASYSIEPYFNLRLNSELILELVIELKNRNFEEIEINKIIKNNTINRDLLPEDLKMKYISCLNLSEETQLKVVSEFQKYVDESISKTINLKNHIKIEDIYNIYIKAYDYNLKGITIYRDGCKICQPKKIK